MALETLIDKIKINKFAQGIGILGIANLSFFAYYLCNTDSTGSEIMDSVSTIISYTNLCLGLKCLISTPILVATQNKSYRKVVGWINEEGYDEKFFEELMEKPCGRSIVKTALKRTGNYEKYAELEKKYPLKSLL